MNDIDLTSCYIVNTTTYTLSRDIVRLRKKIRDVQISPY